MKKILRKTFRTGATDHYGFKNDLDIDVKYDPETKTFELDQVQAYSERYNSFIVVTDIFKNHPFDWIINGINWNEIYNESLIKEANAVINTPYDVMMVTNALTQ